MGVINIKSSDFKKVFNKEIKKNTDLIEEAAAGALNDAGYMARKTLIEEFNNSFNVRSKNFPKAIKYKKAEPGDLEVEIKFPEDWMYVHTTGGDKRPTDPGEHPMLSIPIGGQQRDNRGRIRQRDKPQFLLKYANEHPVKSKGHGAVKRPFILKTKGGEAFIVKREKGNTTEASRRANNGDKFLYTLKPVVKVPQSWDFANIVKAVVTPAYMAKKFDKWVKFLMKKK